jgi:hypothetical protein
VARAGDQEAAGAGEPRASGEVVGIGSAAVGLQHEDEGTDGFKESIVAAFAPGALASFPRVEHHAGAFDEAGGDGEVLARA